MELVIKFREGKIESFHQNASFSARNQNIPAKTISSTYTSFTQEPQVILPYINHSIITIKILYT